MSLFKSKSETPWLDYLIKLDEENFHETPGPDSNPTIRRWADGPGQYPQMEDDSTTPWCGIGMAGVFSDVGMPHVIPKGPASAASWLNCGVPCEAKPGAIAVFPRSGGNHVTCVREVNGDDLLCVGCNQSNAVTTARYSASEARGFRWPTGAVTRKPDIGKPSSYYGDLLQKMQVKPEWQAAVDKAANTIIANKAKYKEVEEQTGVPWIFIGVLHMRESSFNFKTHLHNGDSLAHRTVNVPAGRPLEGQPPYDWVFSAVDAMDYEGFNDMGGWTLETVAERGERYNGLGYKKMGLPSPYLWSGTNNYTRGKYVADGVYDGSAVDKQLGIMPVYIRTMDLAKEKKIRTGSKKIGIIEWIIKAIQGLFATISALFTGEKLGVFKEYFNTVSGVFDTKLLITIALCGAATWIILNWLLKLMMDDAKNGTWVPSGMAQETPPPLYAPSDDSYSTDNLTGADPNGINNEPN